ncbi:hypothetical protein EDB81DRAFT_815992 [Dactylonectria macrodidyma]|uniref:Uncharacterized protein n=1 Tax=Dactylonectria macrodidyma TaxID=307937 RepID=A0A9P9DHX6_9HYPO|nr:hypothetical protein EDB81DRAFT_815992 [Dactylonectria macrodidyma]
MSSTISSSSLPSIPTTAPQPTDPLELTSWALAKAQLIRPHKVSKFQEPYRLPRPLQLNTRSRQGRSSIPKLDLTRTQNIDAILIFIYGIPPVITVPEAMGSSRDATLRVVSLLAHAPIAHTRRAGLPVRSIGIPRVNAATRGRSQRILLVQLRQCNGAL